MAQFGVSVVGFMERSVLERARRGRFGQAAAPFLLGLGAALVCAWNLEAWIVGGGPISTYVAPVALAILAASALLMGARKDAD